jgi:hypothetical protein
MLAIIIARSQKPLFVIVKNSFEHIDFLESFQVYEVPQVKVKVKKALENIDYDYHRRFLESTFEY